MLLSCCVQTFLVLVTSVCTLHAVCSWYMPPHLHPLRCTLSPGVKYISHSLASFPLLLLSHICHRHHPATPLLQQHSRVKKKQTWEQKLEQLDAQESTLKTKLEALETNKSDAFTKFREVSIRSPPPLPIHPVVALVRGVRS